MALGSVLCLEIHFLILFLNVIVECLLSLVVLGFEVQCMMSPLNLVIFFCEVILSAADSNHMFTYVFCS